MTATSKEACALLSQHRGNRYEPTKPVIKVHSKYDIELAIRGARNKRQHRPGQLGDDSSDGIVINGHIRQSDLIFDANSDGNLLTLRFEDPSRSHRRQPEMEYLLFVLVMMMMMMMMMMI